jgi:ketosteroid isomerase-like protein
VGQVALSTQQVDVSGNLAAEVGTAELTVTGPGSQSSRVPVKYVVVWKRQDGGPWLMAVDIWNSLASEVSA